jgi:hypothetical protein
MTDNEMPDVVYAGRVRANKIVIFEAQNSAETKYTRAVVTAEEAREALISVEQTSEFVHGIGDLELADHYKIALLPDEYKTIRRLLEAASKGE